MLYVLAIKILTKKIMEIILIIKYGGKKSSFNDILTFIKKDQIIPDYDISSFSDTLMVRTKIWKNRE